MILKERHHMRFICNSSGTPRSGAGSFVYVPRYLDPANTGWFRNRRRIILGVAVGIVLVLFAAAFL